MGGCARSMELQLPVITATGGRKPRNKSDDFYDNQHPFWVTNIYQFFDKYLVKYSFCS
jgi:hypothetical protein